MSTVERLADDLLSSGEDLDVREADLAETGAGLDEQVAVKLAMSKRVIQAAPAPDVSVVFAMYKETERMLTPSQSPLGEDFINAKIDQLKWLFNGSNGFDLVLVDDGCPDGSGGMAEHIIRQNGHSDIARVLYLSDAIEAGHPAVEGLGHPDESRKGGAIELGMYEAVLENTENQVIVYTDADMSTHLGQIGALTGAIGSGALAAAGSRREPTSVVVKGGARNDRGKVFIYTWKQMLPQLKEIIDSQCGFKGFPATIVRELVSDTVEKKFAFDIELLLKTQLQRPGSIRKVPVAWIDSEAGSTTTDLDPYLPMLQAAAAMHRRYGAGESRAGAFASLVERMTSESWHRLLGNIPQEIVSREPAEYSDWHGVEAADLARAAGLD